MSKLIAHPIWVMSAAFAGTSVIDLVRITKNLGAQGIDLCVFPRDGTRSDHVATHVAYDDFTLDDARNLLDLFNDSNLQLSLGAFENMIGGSPEQRSKNQDHLLKIIRIAHLLGGNENNVAVGTFVGYDHELGNQDGGFEKNLMAYKEIFEPIVRYAEDLGVTVMYENCPMEGWRGSGFMNTYNNLSGVLAARKLMYALIPSAAHGEIYDPSHDVWQNINPVDVIAASDMSRIKRIHVKATRRLHSKSSIEWGRMYPKQFVSRELAQKAGINTPDNDWDRHHYEPMLPGFGGSDSMDWRAFIDELKSRNYTGPFEIENEALNSKGTNNLAAIVQGFESSISFLKPMLWPLDENKGYIYKNSVSFKPLQSATKDIPVVSMKDLRS